MRITPFWDDNEVGYEAPLYAPGIWDAMTIGGEQIPGVVEVAALASISFNKSKASGKSGARLTFTGRDPQPIDLKVYICTPAQWTRWQEVKARVFLGIEAAYDVYHPALAEVGIGSVTLTSIAAPAPGRVPGEKVIAVKLIEFTAEAKRKKNATVTPKASVRRRDEFADAPAASVAAPENGLQQAPWLNTTYWAP